MSKIELSILTILGLILVWMGYPLWLGICVAAPAEVRKMDVKTYIEKEIDTCNFALEKEYQTCADVIRVAELESRMQAFTEVLYFLENKNAPEATTSKGKITL